MCNSLSYGQQAMGLQTLLLLLSSLCELCLGVYVWNLLGWLSVYCLNSVIIIYYWWCYYGFYIVQSVIPELCCWNVAILLQWLYNE